MAGRIEQKFRELRSKGEKALVAYVTAGDPDMERSREIVVALERGGVDILELGIPFSDPTADGPIIQAASRRALKAGTSVRKVLDLVSEVKRTSEMPIILFGYYNPIHAYGPAGFARDAAYAGADGLLVVDLPYEEAHELRRFTDPEGIETITLIAPTTGEERAREMVKDAAGFLYYISVTGVTGTSRPAVEDVQVELAKLRGLCTVPVVVGFGITTPGQAAELAPCADGIVVGSALVRLIHEEGVNGDPAGVAATFVSALKGALRPPFGAVPQ